MLSYNRMINESNSLNSSTRKRLAQNSLEKSFVVLFNNGMIREINPLNSSTGLTLSRKSLCDAEP